jgi:XTP/dITP diphosphohydrolase
MRIVLATNNVHKIEEIKSILTGLEADILTLEDFREFPQVEETGETLKDNAILKAQAVFRFSGLPSLADDSGLEVEALDGAPGVRSSRFGGEQCSFADNNRKLLELLRDVPWEGRRAKFVCVVALAGGPSRIVTVKGELQGFIALQGKGQGGFGYDPVFYVPELNKTLAQLTPEEKNRISHRARAFNRARELILKGFFDD